jgi:LemA protein
MEWIAIGIATFVVLVVVGYFIGVYNTFARGKQEILTQWSNIKLECQRRFDLISQVFEVTKGYATHEKSAFVLVAEARGRNGNYGKTQQEQMKYLKGVMSAMPSINVMVERYPQLKAVRQFGKLSSDLRETEDRIAVSRQDRKSVV